MAVMQSREKEFGSYAPRGGFAFALWVMRHTVLGRGKLRRMMWRLFPSHGHSAYDVRVRNYVMRLFPDDNTVERKLLFRPDRYCPDEIVYLEGVFSKLERGSYIDIGANVGALTLPVAQCAFVNVVAVEPEPKAAERLRFNVEANQLVNIAVEELAITEREGVAELTSHTDDLKFSGINGRWSKGEAVEVKTDTLLNILDRHEITELTAMKIDVEGYEDKILLPFFATQHPARWPKHIIIEAIEREGFPDCIAEMKRIGYVERFKTRANMGLELVL